MKAKSILITALVIVLLIVLGFVGLTAYSSYAEQRRIEQERILAEEEAQRIAAEEQARIEAENARLEDIKNQLRTGVYSDDLKVAFLTFDDGPNEYSNEVLDILAANNVKGTFFPNGRTDPEDEEIYRRIVEEGHVLGNHTWSHNYDNYNNTDAFIDDVLRLYDYEIQVTGVEPVKVFRFPGGSNITNSVNSEAVMAQGFNYFDWTASAGDGGGTPLTGEQTVSKILTEVYANPQVAIILTHAESPNNFATREALDPVIKTLQSQGYTFMTLDPSYNLIKFQEL